MSKLLEVSAFTFETAEGSPLLTSHERCFLPLQSEAPRPADQSQFRITAMKALALRTERI